jgi:hypothetical protein
MMRRPLRSMCSALALCAAIAALPAVAASDFSAAEKLLFMDDQLHGLKPPVTLRYQFRRSGNLESAFEDSVLIKLQADAGGACCTSESEFLTGPRRVELPPVENARSNPVTLGFLERDIREMQRLTGGQPNYFRKRIRMAVYQSATVREVTLPFRGRMVPCRQISVAPYQDDPNRARFGRFVDKRYVFTLSADVPGSVYAIRSQINDPGAPDKPLIVEELLADGASSAAAARVP